MQGLTLDTVGLIVQVLTLAAVGFTSFSIAHLVTSFGRLNVNVQQAVDALTQQLVKSQRELVGRIADVQAQLDAASVPVEVVDLSALTAVAQALDDVVPDAVTPAPVVVEDAVVEDVEPDAEPSA